jgi:hypothetical protein
MRREERQPGKREVDIMLGTTEIEVLGACLFTGPFQCHSCEMRDSICDDENVQWFKNVCVTERLGGQRCWIEEHNSENCASYGKAMKFVTVKTSV